jgi:hypothetical protein
LLLLLLLREWPVMTMRAAQTYSNFKPSPLNKDIRLETMKAITAAVAVYPPAKYCAVPLKKRQLPLAMWLLVDEADAADDATAETTLPLRDDCSGDSVAAPDAAAAAAAGAAKEDVSKAAMATTAAFSSDLSVFPRTETPFASARAEAGRRGGASEAFLRKTACLVTFMGVGSLKTLLLLLLLSASGFSFCVAF